MSGIALLVILLVIVEFGLLIWALIDLALRDRAEIMFNRKWPWVLIIIFISTVGPLLYLLVGRRYA